MTQKQDSEFHSFIVRTTVQIKLDIEVEARSEQEAVDRAWTWSPDEGVLLRSGYHSLKDDADVKEDFTLYFAPFDWEVLANETPQRLENEVESQDS